MIELKMSIDSLILWGTQVNEKPSTESKISTATAAALLWDRNISLCNLSRCEFDQSGDCMYLGLRL